MITRPDPAELASSCRLQKSGGDEYHQKYMDRVASSSASVEQRWISDSAHDHPALVETAPFQECPDKEGR